MVNIAMIVMVHSQLNGCNLFFISLFRVVHSKCSGEMQVLNLLVLLLIFHEVQLKSVQAFDGNRVKAFAKHEIKHVEKPEPRIFFKQIMDASGLFPIEINVPDTISAMMGGLGSMYDSVSSFFGGGSGAATEGGQTQQDVVYDQVDLHSQPVKAKRHRKKKVKKLKKKTEEDDDDDETLFDYFGFLIF